MSAIYLDHCSTTPLHPAVAQAMWECQQSCLGNPASPHQFGQAAKRVLEGAREALARQLGADVAEVGGEQLVFTSGGTESNNLALRGLAGHPPGRILVSAVEHPSVSAPADELARQGFDVRRIPVDSKGLLRLDQLDELLDSSTRLVSVQFGNHETGVVQPLDEIVARCRAHHVPVHSDAVQAVGKVPLHFRRLGLAALTFNAHKIHGPVGIGGLLLRPGLVPRPLLWGGTQQFGIRPGSEPVTLAVGFCCALECAIERRDRSAESLGTLRELLEQTLLEQLPDLSISGAASPRLPHVTNVAFAGLDRQALLLALDRAGVACSSGPACQSGASEPSPVLRAMGLPADVVESALRLSVGGFTTADDVREAARRILNVVKDLKRTSRPGKYSGTPRASRGKPL